MLCEPEHTTSTLALFVEEHFCLDTQITFIFLRASAFLLVGTQASPLHCAWRYSCYQKIRAKKHSSNKKPQQRKLQTLAGAKVGHFALRDFHLEAWNVRRREAMTTSVTVELMAAWTGGYNGSAAAPSNINLHRKSKHEQILDKTQVVAPPLL